MFGQNDPPARDQADVLEPARLDAADTEIAFSIIVPIYKNEETLLDVLDRFEVFSRVLPGPVEGVFVVDGSPDDSHMILNGELPERSFSSQLILLARNFGSFAAIRMGLTAARGKYFAIMAADLQEPPELVLEFFSSLQEGAVDVTLGVRAGRNDPMKGQIASWLFWKAYRMLVQPEVPIGGIDVFGCNKKVRDVLISLHEANSTLIGLLLWVGFRKKPIEYVRLPRPSGESGWSFRRKLKYMLDSTYAFSDLPVRLLLLTGCLGILGAGLASVVVFMGWAFGIVTVKGYTPIVLAILLSTSLILFSMGVIGGYVWRAFENSKQRPLHISMFHRVFGRGDRT